MALPNFTDVLKAPNFQALPEDQKISKAQEYWNAYRRDNPDDFEFADSQEKDSLGLLRNRQGLDDLAPVDRDFRDTSIQAAKINIASREAVRSGKLTVEEAQQFQQQQFEQLQPQIERASKLRGLYEPRAQNDLDSLIEPARNTGWFGSPPLANSVSGAIGGYSQEQYQEIYNQQRDATADAYGLTTEQLDDVVRHRMDVQEAPVSRDALGMVHVKPSLLSKPKEEIEKAIKSSDLPESIKSNEIEGLDKRLSEFKLSVVNNILTNHPEFARNNGISLNVPGGPQSEGGSVDENFKKINDALSSNRLENEATAFAGAAFETISDLDRFSRGDGKAITRFGGEEVVPGLPPGVEMSTAPSTAEQISQTLQSKVAIGNELKKESMRIFGATGGAIGAGAESVVESLGIAALTRGFVPPVAAGASRTAQAANRLAQVAPVASIFGARQGVRTYEQALEQGLSEDEAQRLGWSAGVIEGGITALFSTAGFGGIEDIGSNAGKQAMRESVKSAFREAAKTGGKSIFGELTEEQVISALDTAINQTKINPNLSVEDFKTTLYDTAVATLLPSAGPSALHSVATYKQTNEQLRQRANQIPSEENFFETETERGDVSPPSQEALAEERKALNDRLVSLEGDERSEVEERLAEIDEEIGQADDLENIANEQAQTLEETEASTLEQPAEQLSESTAQENVTSDDIGRTEIQDTVNEEESQDEEISPFSVGEKASAIEDQLPIGTVVSGESDNYLKTEDGWVFENSPLEKSPKPLQDSVIVSLPESRNQTSSAREPLSAPTELSDAELNDRGILPPPPGSTPEERTAFINQQTSTITTPEERVTRHRVFNAPQPIPVKSGEGVLEARNPATAYRTTGQSQIDDIIQSGEVRSREGKIKGGRSGETQWSQGNNTLGYRAKSGQYVIETNAEGLNERQGGLPLSEITRIWKPENGQWVDVTEEIRNQYAANQQSNPSAVEGTGMEATTVADPVIETTPQTEPVSTPSRTIEAEEETVMRSTNASLDRSLKKYDLPPITTRAPGKLREWWNQAVVEVSKDPTKGVRLTEEIVSKPRAINELELNVLAYTRATQEVRTNRTREEINAAEAAGNSVLAQELNSRIQGELADLQTTSTAIKIGTSTAGKVLRASQVGVDENYSLVSMQNRVQAEINVGKPLAQEQNKTIRDLHNRIKEAEEQGQAAVVETEARVRAELEKYYTELLAKEARSTPRKRKGAKTQSEKLADIERSISDASARLRKKLNQFGSGPDVTIIGDLAVIGIGYLRKGFISLNAYRNEMQREYGNEIEQYVEQAFERSKELLANSGLNKSPEQLLAEIDPSKPANRQTIWNMAKAYAGQGLKASELVDKVRSDLQTKWPDISRRTVTELINEYGQTVRPPRSALQQELADLRRYAALTKRIEELKAGKPAVVRKREKGVVNEEIRQLQEQAKELAKSTKLATPKDPLAAAKSRLRKEADALDNAVRNNELIQRPQRTAQTDAELEALKARRDQARNDYNEAFPEQGTQITPNQEIDRVVKSLDKQIEREEKGIVRDLKDFSWFSPEISERRRLLDAKRQARNEIRWQENAEKSAREAINRAEEIIRTGKLPEASAKKQRTPIQNLQVLWDTRNQLQGVVSAMRREGQAVTNLEKSIAELERRIAEKDFSTKPRKVSTDPQVVALRETRKELQKTFSRLKKPLKTKEDRTVDAINKRTAEIRKRITSGDFSKEIKPTKVETDRIIKARLEEFKAKEEWNHLFFENNLKNASTRDKAIRIASQPIELLRTWKTMFDLPPIFRQGVGVLVSNPSIALKAWPKSFAAGFQAGIGNDALAKKAEMAIRDNPQFDLFNAAGLAITQSGQFASLKTQEEEFRGSLIKKIPIIKNAANYSEANYVTFLNELRIGLATQLGNYLTRAGSTPTLAEAKVIADYVNNVTGRGSLRGLEGAANALSSVLFSPRYWASRLNFLAGGVRATVDLTTGFKFVPSDVLRARKAVAREYAKVMIGYGMFYGSLILAAAGYDDPEDKFSIEWNPLSSDFGKVKIGKTRIDPLGGLAGHMTFISRALSLHNKTLDGQTYFLPDAKGNQQSYFGIISNYFVRTKLAPIYGSIINVGTGKDVVGKKSTVRSEIAGTLLPLSVTDIAENFEEYGPAGGVGLSFLTLLGAGTNTYDDGLTWPQRAAVAMGGDPAAFAKKGKGARLSLR